MGREAGRRLLIPRVDVLGVQVSAINMDMALAVVESWISDGAREYVCITGVHGVIESQDDPELMRIHNESGMTTPDGMPLVWSGKYAGASWMDRVYGPDLMLAVCEQSISHDWSHFFYGAGPGVADELARNLQNRFPGLRVVGTHTPPFRELTGVEEANVVSEINASGADVLWVGLSTPKQERWMASMRSELSPSVLVGVGAAFDIHAGLLRQAPRWIQRSGLEWLFRLAIEPKRLWRRYLRANPRFLLGIVRRRPRLTQ